MIKWSCKKKEKSLFYEGRESINSPRGFLKGEADSNRKRGKKGQLLQILPELGARWESLLFIPEIDLTQHHLF